MQCFPRFDNYRPSTKAGYPIPALSAVVFFVIRILLHFREDSQFTLSKILEFYPDVVDSKLSHIADKLREHFRHELTIQPRKDDYVRIFRDVGEKVLTDLWYKNQCANVKDERNRVVTAAAKIILEDICEKYYDGTV